MRLNILASLILFLSTMSASYAGDGDRMALSLSPYLRGGMMGIKDTSYSPLAYNGPHGRIGFSILAQGAKADLFVDASGSFGWLGNRYHRDASSIHDRQMEMSVGGLVGIFGNSIVSVKAGGAVGFMRNDQFIWLPNTLYDRFHYTFAFDAKTCVSVAWKLSQKWSLRLEDRLPVAAFISPSNRFFDSRPDSPLDYTFKAFPGNDLTLGICRTLSGRNGLMLSIRHFCYSSGQALPHRFQLQFLEIGFAFRFGLTKHPSYEL